MHLAHALQLLQPFAQQRKALVVVPLKGVDVLALLLREQPLRLRAHVLLQRRVAPDVRMLLPGGQLRAAVVKGDPARQPAFARQIDVEPRHGRRGRVRREHRLTLAHHRAFPGRQNQPRADLIKLLPVKAHALRVRVRDLQQARDARERLAVRAGDRLRAEAVCARLAQHHVAALHEQRRAVALLRQLQRQGDVPARHLRPTDGAVLPAHVRLASLQQAHGLIQRRAREHQLAAVSDRCVARKHHNLTVQRRIPRVQLLLAVGERQLPAVDGRLPPGRARRQLGHAAHDVRARPADFQPERDHPARDAPQRGIQVHALLGGGAPSRRIHAAPFQQRADHLPAVARADGRRRAAARRNHQRRHMPAAARRTGDLPAGAAAADKHVHFLVIQEIRPAGFLRPADNAVIPQQAVLLPDRHAAHAALLHIRAAARKIRGIADRAARAGQCEHPPLPHPGVAISP